MRGDYRVTVRIDTVGGSPVSGARMVAGKREEVTSPVSLAQVHARSAEEAIAAAQRLLEASRPQVQVTMEEVPLPRTGRRRLDPLPSPDLDDEEEDEEELEP